MSSFEERAQGCVSESSHDQEIPEVDVLSSMTMRGLTFRNRIMMAPMCQYSAVNGMADDWHLVHLGSRAVGGAALVMVEATAVTAEGRISPGDLGIYDDQQVEPLARIARFIKRVGAIPSIQLAHAGRKAGCDTPWNGGRRLSTEAGGWQPLGPSAVAFSDDHAVPRALDAAGIDEVVEAFKRAARRALAAGFEVLEIHAAHGYLLHSFLSPLSNHRTDNYGGSLENRMRLLLRVAEALRQIMPDHLPLFTRISATDWVEGGWDVAQSVALARELKRRGVDLIDCSSGGVVPKAKIPVGAGYQVPFSRQIRREADIATGAVGLITTASQANEVITAGDADFVLLGRELLRNPYWAVHTQGELGEQAAWPLQYGYAVKRPAR